MKFEEPKVEFISVARTNIFTWASPCVCVDGSSGNTNVCVGVHAYDSDGEGDCGEDAALIA